METSKLKERHWMKFLEIKLKLCMTEKTKSLTLVKLCSCLKTFFFFFPVFFCSRIEILNCLI